MQKYPGFLDFYWDEQEGKIWLEVDKWDQEILYINSLPAGVGSNDIGLDRGQLGRRRIVTFRRFGPKVLMIQPNYSFRAITDNEAERRSVEEAFAKSTLWGFTVAAEEDNRVLVDASDFFLRDVHNVVRVLKRRNQGNYQLEPSRSAFYPDATKNFPRNTEVDVTLTFVGESPGNYVRQVVPTPEAITVRQHHSFVQLPDAGYQPRIFDPRAGFFGIRYKDYATPISESLVKRFIARHRLKKKTPEAEVSEPIEPIVYYVDPGAPEPIRSALMEGAQWWNQAFEAIGYKNALQVKILPEDADPLDVRYNVIQWVHRSTRGWSYGSSVIDPRTGEIIKGHVSLGSLRVRQDFLIAEGLLAPYEEGESVPSHMQEMALARLRQLSAHEVGHTLGLAHNFAASVSNRASVMDYPHPLVKITSHGSFDLSDAYDTGIGEWDKVTIAYGYQDFPENTNESQKLDEILSQSIAKGLIFISDQDARPAGGAHPLAHLWDNGTNAAEELNRIMKIRNLALSRFSENNIRRQAPFATLEEVLVPIYLFHRYQVDAASKLLGGLTYTYALRGDGQQVTDIVAASQQRQALDALLATLKPEALALPERILNLIPPRAYGYGRDRETFNIRTAVTFDPLASAETAANLTVEFLLHPARATRLIEYHARKQDYPGFGEVLDRLISETWQAEHGTGYHAEIRRVVDNVVLHNLMSLAANERASNQVRAVASFKLDELRQWLNQELGRANEERQKAHLYYANKQIQRFQEHPEKMNLTKLVEPPAGSPIGSDFNFIGFGCDF
ncbi:DUF5117 domain-containing protein [candidate division KSB1 bacterium]|nr:DUF5117 domain-containing protein [candidate division KSB1 bacterium]NIR70055.1 DUF5117 domain-containing protein [candidate division KSB1 bacterium]NIS27493.1 DUF5117 domain-containing protein [candidate division KSB1 bacterium]NIT74342.1 DUF5117 domain-containing protein [candidate division KSB1 bacterium]NIU28211.1 DUF5117 domain-containing protein [candidate division KSB1 bacterium]